MKKVVFLLGTAILLSGCMTKREAFLRKKDIEAKKAHQQTFSPLTIKGKMTLEEGSELVVNTPTQPFVPADIPNGAQIQASAIRDVAGIAGMVGLGTLGIMKAGDTTKTYNVASEKGE